MRDQIIAAVGFLMHLIWNQPDFGKERLKRFEKTLFKLLYQKFRGHWYPEIPEKGNGYRCIRLTRLNKKDEILEKCTYACGIRYEDFLSRIPPEITIWIDPNEVSYRYAYICDSFSNCLFIFYVHYHDFIY